MSSAFASTPTRSEGLKVTVSLGVAEVGEHRESADLIVGADDGLHGYFFLKTKIGSLLKALFPMCFSPTILLS